MKRIISIVCSLVLPIFLISQSFYTVNVGTFVDAKSPQFDDIRPLGFVYAYQMDGGLSQVYLGGYDNMQAAADAAAAIQKRGYRSAYVEERALAQGRTVTVIQLATRETDKLIDWDRFDAFAPLYGILNGSQIKIVTGIYPDVEAAQRVLPSIRQAGYADAFIKNVNNTLLIRISEFETGIKKPLIPIPDINTTAQREDTRRPGPTGYDQPVIINDRLRARTPVTEPIIVDNSPPATNLPRTKAGAVALPEIRSRVKRRSVLDLQKVLKAEGTYKSSLDGYYGQGTKSGYEAFKSNDREFQKYIVLADYFGPANTAATGSRLQQAINNLLDDPAAPLTVENSALPVAKGYQAYLLFRTVGAGTDVNTLMNAAIREAYADRNLTDRPPFDYNATYAYQDLDQLILHLHYLHAAPGNQLAAPCWLYEEHPKETASAHATFARYGSENFKLQACDQFLTWEEIKVLRAIAADMNDDAKTDAAKVATYASARSQLFLAPRALDAEENKAAERWHDQLWSGLNGWASRDPMHDKIVRTLKVAYFQSQVRLEDYFMDKGFNQEEAKGLALATLKTLIGYQLERFA